MKVVITGGSGLIGTEVSSSLLKEGHEVIHLSRNPQNRNPKIKEHYWNPDKEEIDFSSLEKCDAIINLAGAPIQKPWTPAYKNEILRSRVDGTRLLFDTVRKNDIPVKTIVSASAVGYYPSSYEKTYSESDAPGNNFLSLVCQKWEQEVQAFERLNIREVRCRTGLVLSGKGGVLPLMNIPFKYGLGAPLGDGKQWMTWIHIDDLASMFLFCLKNDQLHGACNACSPNSVTNSDFSKTVARVLGKPFFMPGIPEIAIKTVMGERAQLVLSSQKVSSAKIESAGFQFKYPDLEEALRAEL